MTALRKLTISELRNGHAAIQRRAERGVTRMKNSTAMMPTTVASKTPVGLDAEIRAKVAATLIRFPTKSIESGGNLSDEGVRLLKNGRRTISTETLIKLARAKGELGPAVWSMICELCERPGSAEHESPRLNSLFGALHVIAKANGPVGEFASAMIREMNADEVKRPPAPSAGYDPNGAMGNLFDFPQQQQRRRVHGTQS